MITGNYKKSVRMGGQDRAITGELEILGGFSYLVSRGTS